MTYPLNLACKHGCPIGVIKLLINSGADLNRREDGGYSPIEYSYLMDRFQTFELLLESGAYLENHSWFAFTIMRDKKFEYLKLLVESGFNLDELLMNAVSFARHDTIKYLISAGADVNYGEWDKPLAYAISSHYNKSTRKQSLKSVKILLEAGADPNLYGELGYPLSMAADEGREDIIDMLLEYGAKINDEHGFSYALTLASSNHDCLKIVEKLLNLGASVNGTTKTESPLFSAIQSGNIDIVKLLLDHGADVRHKIKRRGTVMDLAFKLGHVEMIKLMGEYV